MPEQVLPIKHGCTSFEILGIATLYLLDPRIHIAAVQTRQRPQDRRLIAYLGLHRLLPKLFAQRLRSRYLPAKTFGLGGVPRKGKQKSRGHPPFVAGNDRRLMIQQCRQGPLGDRDLTMVEHDHTDVLDRDTLHRRRFETFGEGIALFDLGQADLQLVQP